MTSLTWAILFLAVTVAWYAPDEKRPKLRRLLWFCVVALALLSLLTVDW